MLGTVPRVADEAAAPGLAHGAVVVPPGGGKGVEDAHGALVGWSGPAGTPGPWARIGMRDEAGAGPLERTLVVCGLASARGSRIVGTGRAEGAFDFGWEEV